jgi:hypothetical protein
MKIRSTDLQCNLSTCIFLTTTLFAVTSLFQLHSILRTSSDHHVQTQLRPNSPLFFLHPDDNEPVVVVKGFAMNHLNASENILTPVSNNVATKTKLLARATATGASSNHFRTLIAFLKNYKTLSKNIPLFTYDLGLTATELAFLRVNYSWTTIRTFNFSQYPPFFKIEGHHGRYAAGGYAWKPMIIKEMLDTTTSVVLWLDSGARLTKANTLENTFSQIKRDGHVTAVSSGTTQDWVHAATLAFLHVPTLKVTMCNAGLVGFDMRAYEKVIRPWAKCAMDRLCIAPPGVSLANHRYDQAVLTVLLYQAERPFLDTNEGLGILIHQDHNAPAVII